VQPVSVPARKRVARVARGAGDQRQGAHGNVLFAEEAEAEAENNGHSDRVGYHGHWPCDQPVGALCQWLRQPVLRT
jgi:hypothetical protein